MGDECITCHHYCPAGGIVACDGCHDTAEKTSDESRIKCHDAEEKPLIFHPIVGYKIPVYWRWLTCSSCHPGRTYGESHSKLWSAGSRPGNTEVDAVGVTISELSAIERASDWNKTVLN
jgi:hypothetical protein